MGNPEILRRAAALEPVQPPRLKVTWTVYRLRDRGQKLARDAVLRTGRAGLLEFWRSSDGERLNARLIDVSGDSTLDSLEQVQLVRGHRDGGLLLYGKVLSVARGIVCELPQGWWCVVSHAEGRRGS